MHFRYFMYSGFISITIWIRGTLYAPYYSIAAQTNTKIENQKPKTRHWQQKWNHTKNNSNYNDSVSLQMWRNIYTAFGYVPVLFGLVWFGLVILLLWADVQFVPMTLNIFEYSCNAFRCMAVFASNTFQNSVCLLTKRNWKPELNLTIAQQKWCVKFLEKIQQTYTHTNTRMDKREIARKRNMFQVNCMKCKGNSGAWENMLSEFSTI